MKHSPGNPQRAFTFIELIMSVVVGTIILSALTVLLSSFGNTYIIDPVSENEEDIPVAPAYEEVTDALNLVVTLKKDLNDCSAVFILGGSEETGIGKSFVSTDANFELNLASLPSDFTTIHPSQINSPVNFRAYLKTKYTGDTDFSDGDAADFTAFLIRNNIAHSLIGILKSRRSTLTQGDVDYAVYDVSYSKNGTVEYSYKFAIPVSRENDFTAEMKPGVTHFWLRENSDWNISEHLGYKLTIPDPTAIPYSLDGDTTAQAFSKFIFYIPTKR